MGEELHHGMVLIRGLPPRYQNQAKLYLEDFSHRLCQAFLSGDFHSLSCRNHGLNDMVVFLQDLSVEQQLQEKPSRTNRGNDSVGGTHSVATDLEWISCTVLSQLYDTVHLVLSERLKLLATVRTTFPLWHYLNLTMLAMAICTIFLMEVDRAVIQFVDTMELRTCWAILVGAFSTLGIVCYDLTTPYSGIFRVR